MHLQQSWNDTLASGTIPLKTAKNAIIEALTKFDPALGTHAANILNNPERANIIEGLTTGKARNVQCCRPAGMNVEFLRQNNMHIEDYAKSYAPFETQINTTGQAIIDFAYHGTPQSVIYLSHELGHAIADDMQRNAKRSFKDFSADELEEQAYFVQNIFTNYTGQESPESKTLQGLSSNKPLNVSWDRAMQYAQAENRFDTAATLPVNQRNARILFALGGMIDIDASTENNLTAAGLNPA